MTIRRVAVLLALSLSITGAARGMDKFCFAASNSAKPPGLSDQISASLRLSGALEAGAAGAPRAPIGSFKSLLVPGWGQLAGGEKTRGYLFLTTEVLLVGGLLSQTLYQGWLEDDYRIFAVQHAGVQGDRDHQYYVDVGNWMTVGEYNEQRLRYRQIDEMFTDPAYDWRWDSEENRAEFKNTRLRADAAGQRVLLFGGGLLLNHLLSFIDASRLTHSGRSASLSTTPDGATMVKLAMTH